MTQYINKDTLVAEIENLIKKAEAERVLYPQTIKAAKNYLLIEDYKKLLSIIDTLKVKEDTMMTNEQKAAAWDKASELAAAATKTDRATYEEVRQACIDMSKWQAEQYEVLLDAKDEDIVQCEMSMFERICQVCRYRCAKIGDTYKCAYEKSFGTLCKSINCEFLK